MRRIHPAEVALGLGLLLFAPRAILGQTPGRTPVASTPHFAFYDDFDTNLNDALIAAGVARKGGKPELFHAGDEVVCFGKLPPSARVAWERAVDYYREVISPVGFGDRQQYLLRADLAGFDEEAMDADARQFTGIARSFRAAATPAYTACRWAAQDEKNRRFIEDLKTRLAADEKKVAPRLEELYGQRWGKLPIPVDIVETVDWSGANSILLDPLCGHLLVASSNPSASALEIVFHEASHLLMGRDAPVKQALGQAASAAAWTLPGDLWHVVLFYTTGETVRRILEADGQPGYTPMLYEIFERGSWGEYRQALEGAWRPYVDGKRPLPAAAADLVEALRSPVPPLR
jgi:hypothetical protein